jgi:hypothetical protein
MFALIHDPRLPRESAAVTALEILSMTSAAKRRDTI